MATPLTARDVRAHELVDALAIADGLRQKLEKYHTTTESCECRDAIYRHVVCKHRIALQLLEAQKSGEK